MKTFDVHFHCSGWISVSAEDGISAGVKAHEIIEGSLDDTQIDKISFDLECDDFCTPAPMGAPEGQD